MNTTKARRGGAVIYEVDLEIDSAIAAEYREWLRGHIAEMLALPGFTGARASEVMQPALDAYLREHAPRMRADGVARFGDRFRAQRRVLSALRR